MTTVDALATTGEAGVGHGGAWSVRVVVSARLDEVVDRASATDLSSVLPSRCPPKGAAAAELTVAWFAGGAGRPRQIQLSAGLLFARSGAAVASGVMASTAMGSTQSAGGLVEWMRGETWRGVTRCGSTHSAG